MSTIVFDGDETLYFSAQEYDRASTAFLDYMQNLLPHYRYINRNIINAIYTKIDQGHFAAWGIRRGRLAQSMADTYLSICQQIKALYGEDIYNQEDEETIRDIGDRPFDFTKHFWAPGAEETLAELVKRGNTLCLYSKYDKEVWANGRADWLEIERFFKPGNILLTDMAKTREGFLEVSRASEKPNEDFIAVGNSKDDLLMVTEVNDPQWRGFYIAIPTTSPGEQESRMSHDELVLTPLTHDRIVTVKSIPEILEFI